MLRGGKLMACHVVFSKEDESMELSTINGMDIAKHSFALHGASQDGSNEIGKSLKRDKALDFLSEQPACLVAIEC